MLLDFTRDCSPQFLEPTLSVATTKPLATDSDADDEEDLERQFSKIELDKRSKFATSVEPEDEESSDALQDFHLAEKDLVACLVRTNVVQRIK